MFYGVLMTKQKPIAVRPRSQDLAVIEKLVEKKGATPAGVVRELIAKAIDAGLAV